MAGTTINPYRFGAGLGYRRDGPNRLYIRERHIDMGRGRWLNRDPVNFDGEDKNLYRYAANNPVNNTDPEGLWTEWGTATCFNDAELFCNHDPKNPKCPDYKHGMTGAWPNVTQVKVPGCCGTDKRHYNNNLPEYVGCGSKITVRKGNCSVTITIIDAGPNQTAASNAIVDLSPPAAKVMFDCLKAQKSRNPIKHKNLRKPKKPTKSRPFHCISFEVDGVTVSG